MLRNALFVSLLLLIHFQIYVHKFLVHLRTVYASPQFLVRPLRLGLTAIDFTMREKLSTIIYSNDMIHTTIAPIKGQIL